MGRPHAFDLVFTDTCLGGSTVAARVGTSAAGLHAYYLADYAVNPLGVKPAPAVRAALDRWIDAASVRAGTLIIACNTASVLLERLPDVRDRAARAGLRLISMVELLDRVLAAVPIAGSRVCLMGTQFTVSQPVYRDRLIRAGAAEVLPVAATRTEHTIAHLAHACDEGRREVEDEVGNVIRRSDVVVLACTLFPLILPLLRQLNPACVFVDPASGADHLIAGTGAADINRLTVAFTGGALALDDVRGQAPVLFPGWTIESVEANALDHDLLRQET